MLRRYRKSPPGRDPYPDREFDRLRGELHALRLSLDCELSAAVGALEEAQPQLAAELLGAGQAQVAEFARRALPQYGVQTTPPRPAARARRRAFITAGTLAALTGTAAAAAAATLLLLPAKPADHPVSRRVSATAAPATPPETLPAALAAFRAALFANARNPIGVLQAGAALHSALLPLVARAAHDPAAARTLVTLLHEAAQLLTTLHPVDATLLLAQVQSMISEVAALPDQLAPAPASPALASPSTPTSPTPQVSRMPSPAATPSPQGSASPTSSAGASPTPAPHASERPSPGNPQLVPDDNLGPG